MDPVLEGILVVDDDNEQGGGLKPHDSRINSD